MKKNDSRSKIGIFGSVPLFAIPLTTHNELKALVAISSFQGADEFAFPSMDKLALRADLSLSALSKAVTGLVKKELVSRKKRYGHSNIYFLLYKTESLDEIKAENKKVAAMQRARNKRKNSDALNQLDNRIEQDKHALNQLDHDALNEQDDILKEHSKRTFIKEQEEKKDSLSYLNLKSKFAEKLKSKNIQYFESRKEYGSISLMQELKIEPKEILDMVDILEEVKKNNPNDKFLQGICFTMSHLVSYRANIYNAHNATKSNVVTFPTYDKEQLRKEGWVV